MNIDESKEIKKTLSTKKNNIKEIVGAYINSTGEIRATFRQEYDALGVDTTRKMASLFKKAIADDTSKNHAVVKPADLNMPEWATLELLRDEELSDNNVLQTFMSHVAETYHCAGKDYLLIMAYNVYDVPADMDGDGEKQSFETFRYIIGVICPTKPMDFAVNYSLDANKLKTFILGSPLGTPAAGFLYPTFENRATNYDSALLFLKDKEQTEFSIALFGAPTPKEAFPQEEAPTAKSEVSEETVNTNMTGSDAEESQAFAEQSYKVTETENQQAGTGPSAQVSLPSAETGKLDAVTSGAEPQAGDFLQVQTPPEPQVQAGSKRITVRIPEGMRKSVREQVVNGEQCLVIRLADVESISE